MKKFCRPFIIAGAALLSVPMLQSCLNDDDNDYDYSYWYPDAIVTVKPVVDEGSEYFFFQLDDNTRLWPVDNSDLPYGEKEVRAFVKYTETDMPEGVDGDVYQKAVQISWMDSILTKKAVAAPQDMDDAGLDLAYGNDPVEIFKDWTVVEDGYITIHYYTNWGDTNIKHSLNLITGLNPDDPYEVCLKHDANGDYSSASGDAMVAFRLDGLPDTQGETVKLTLRFDSFSGEKTVKFDYRTRVD